MRCNPLCYHNSKQWIVSLVLVGLTAANICAASQSLNNPMTKDHSTSQQIFTEDKTNFLLESKYPLFTIKLKSNPSTGYQWYLREYDNQLIAPIGRTVVKGNNKNEHIIGTSGFEMWQFRMKSTGFRVPQQTLLRFVYARPWSASDSSTQLVFRISTASK